MIDNIGTVTTRFLQGLGKESWRLPERYILASEDRGLGYSDVLRNHIVARAVGRTAMDNNKETQTLIREAYHKIKQMIFQDKLIPGQRLVYRDLCNMLDMSRTPIINALNQLEQEGFVVSESFRGFYVKPIDLQESWDLFGVREALETYTVEQAIQRADATDIEVLKEKLRNHEQYMPPYYNRKKFLLDAEFHMQIAAMAKNQLLERLLKANLEHVSLRFKFNDTDPNRMSPAVREHHELLERMKKKDVLGSIEIIRAHVQRARNHIISSLSKEEEISYL